MSGLDRRLYAEGSKLMLFAFGRFFIGPFPCTCEKAYQHQVSHHCHGIPYVAVLWVFISLFCALVLMLAISCQQGNLIPISPFLSVCKGHV